MRRVSQRLISTDVALWLPKGVEFSKLESYAPFFAGIVFLFPGLGRAAESCRRSSGSEAQGLASPTVGSETSHLLDAAFETSEGFLQTVRGWQQ